MAKMSIFNPNMAKLLPKFMKTDETDVALSHAMDVLLAEPANRAKILRKWDQIDNMNDAQLDEMAWEFNIDWWDSSFSLETKRSVIRTCYRVHEKRGTKWAVEELITSAFGMGKVTEWFEYGGQPYWFKIQTNATLTKDGMLYFLNMIDKVKNARSHVEMIEVTRTIQQPLHGGTAYHSFSKCVVLDHFQETRKAEITQHGGTGRGSYHSRNSIMDYFALEYSAGIVSNVGTAAGQSQSKAGAIEHFDDVQPLELPLAAGVAHINHIKNIIKEE